MAAVNKDIRDSLERLEQLVRLAGDNGIGDHIQKIIQSPNQITSLKEVFSSFFRRTKEPDQSELERRNFFAEFRTPEGKLSSKDVDDLVYVTKNWNLSTERVEILKEFAKIWDVHPALFWFSMPDDNSTRRCIEELERIQEIDPSRRKAFLVILAQDVENERDRISKDLRVKKRKRRFKDKQTQKRICYDRAPDLRKSIQSLCSSLYPGISEDQQKVKQAKVSTHSRYGWKWGRLRPVSTILSLPQVNTRRYEMREWKQPEFEAVNAFIKSLPQFNIINYLNKAWDSIVAFQCSDYQEQLQAIKDIYTSVLAEDALSSTTQSYGKQHRPNVLNYLPGLSSRNVNPHHKKRNNESVSTHYSRTSCYPTGRNAVHSNSPNIEDITGEIPNSNSRIHDYCTKQQIREEPNIIVSSNINTCTATRLADTHQNADPQTGYLNAPALSTLQSVGNPLATQDENADLGAQDTVDLLPGPSVPHIDPVGQDLFPSQLQSLAAPFIDPFGQNLFPSHLQGLAAPFIDPFGQYLFPSQLRSSPASHIDSAGHLLHSQQRQNTSTPNADSLIPQSIRLSSPELMTAVGNVINNIQQNLDQHRTQA